ncbi:hypothetical protein AB1Y20_013292 [Prymnesium parvum]|uniref:RRM domain-containing protein n=1 Tax=Prymnesium parvum TaxID=97485 RepID=A0AB34IK69_PRYPA
MAREGSKNDGPAPNNIGSFCCSLDGVPDDATLSNLEQLFQPLCAGRILMIGLYLHGRGVIEFERESDADACVGTRLFLGRSIRVDRRGAAVETPTKRQCRRSLMKQDGAQPQEAARIETVPIEVAPAAASETTQSKKIRAETKREKERRLNRVGLSYRCGRCGQPKKGHVCHLAEGETLEGMAPAGADEYSEGEKTPGIAWDLDSEALFKDIKSVLSKPMTPSVRSGAPSALGYVVNDGGSSSARGAATEPRGKPTKSKRKPSASAKGAASAPAVTSEKLAILKELDIEMQRPPSLITPDEAEGRPGVPGPSSLASDMFSPGQLMSTLLGTPTPGPQGLSPGTLNELGNLLQSPASVLASARRTRSQHIEQDVEAAPSKA